MTPKLYFFEWKDHSAHAGWIELEDINPEALIVHTVGWVMKETKDLFITAPGLDKTDDSPIGFIKILKSCIVKKKRLYV